ncbi:MULTISPECIES: hypothetical protein [Pseudomonas]|uniref:hypothetical protein n=1 Tax=Pseudomonas TaxID=286 RepID=UPI001AE854A4|nr:MULTISPECIES: hypothetical protein [Pseudomonas]MBP2081683.1 hypothetical protein [Pseudomonas sp. PvP089]MBP2086700.1 hypothetical protein [Pseudomonas sp. PvP088]MBP2221139.1 hypothetical protein [Pseudomonas putida]
MIKKIQGALGKNAKTHKPDFEFAKESYSDIGQIILNSTRKYLDTYLKQDDGSSLTTSIFSQNLRESAKFSAKSARIAYLLGKGSLLGEHERKGIVRTQIIEYGAVCEAILLDLIQSVGANNLPIDARPSRDVKNNPIDWESGGLFSTIKNKPAIMKYRFDFKWLIEKSTQIGAIDKNLNKRVSHLRKSRNLVHPVIPTAQRYTDDIQNSRAARDTAIAVRDACTAFKEKHGLALP